MCSRKNWVFLFGALINLTVRVDAYFHPIKRTYPIQSGPFFRAAPNWGKPAKHFLFLRTLQKGQTSYCLLFNSSSIDTMRKVHLVVVFFEKRVWQNEINNESKSEFGLLQNSGQLRYLAVWINHHHQDMLIAWIHTWLSCYSSQSSLGKSSR